LVESFLSGFKGTAFARGHDLREPDDSFGTFSEDSERLIEFPSLLSPPGQLLIVSIVDQSSLIESCRYDWVQRSVQRRPRQVRIQTSILWFNRADRQKKTPLRL
jgi:hypothetical protein